MKSSHITLVLSLLFFTGCPLRTLSQNVAGPPPSAAAALGVQEACPTQAVAQYARPLVVDMPATDRGDLELAMRDGLVLVRYDCTSLRVVPDCSVPSFYAFAPLNLKEEVVRLANADEIKANLPFSGWGISAGLGGELSRGSSLDIALMMVGKQRTTRAVVNRGDLIEARPGACAEATHFVRGASLGAFALSKGSEGKVGGSVELKGVPHLSDIGAQAASSSSQSVLGRDGSVEACRAASSQDVVPPRDCSALLRLELTVVDPSGAPKLSTPRDDERAADLCAPGLVFVQGKCAHPTSGVAHLCAPGDVADCRAQCDLGDPGSCSRVGYFHQNGLYGVPRDPARAAALYRKACDGGWAVGCGSLGALHVLGEGVPRDANLGVKLVEQACDMGMSEMCSFLSAAFYTGNMVPKDGARAASFARRGCDGGAGSGCFILGEVTRTGLGGVRADPVAARQLYIRGCDGGDPMGCYGAGVAIEDGLGGPADPAGARIWFKRGCDAGFPPACDELKKNP